MGWFLRVMWALATAGMDWADAAVGQVVTGGPVRQEATEPPASRASPGVLAGRSAHMVGDDRARLEDIGPSGAVSPELGLRLGRVTVMDVNRALGMVILDAGGRQGIRPGMALVAVRDGRPVARVRVVDVRREIAGAVVQQTETGRYPEARDGLLMVAGSRD